MFRKIFMFVAVLATALLYGCGGGGGGQGATVSPPLGLAYDQASVVYTVGEAIPANNPHSTGGPISEYSVEPQLPAGLNLDTRTGVISGTPQHESSAANYTVTGTNAASKVSTTVRIEVATLVTAPGGLAYTEPSATYSVGEQIADNYPNPYGGAVDHYTISKPLPSGLSFSEQTGVISGTPQVAAAADVYTVTASNSKGSVHEDLTIGVDATPQAPTRLWYSQSWAVYANGRTIATNEAHHSGGDIDNYALAAGSPPLPAGLSVDPATGNIDGTPTATSNTTTYTIVGTGAAGAVSAQVKIEVVNPGTWVPTLNPMSVERRNFVQVVLPSGKVLVAGGIDATGNALNSAELYDPDSGTWTTAGTMNAARYGAVGVLLPDGRVLVAGGRDDAGALSSAELYDPNGRDVPWQLTAAMDAPRTNAMAALTNNGLVLVAGGDNGAAGSGTVYKTTTIYDPQSATWSTGVQLNLRTADATALALQDGQKIVIPGGHDDNFLASNKSQMTTDPGTVTWTNATLVNGARYRYSAIALTSDTALIFGGNTATANTLTASIEAYDATSGTWASAGNLVDARSSAMVAPLDGGSVLIAGGKDGNGLFGTNSTEIYGYNSAAPTQSTDVSGTPMTAVRIDGRMTALQDGNVLAVGGWDNNGGSQYWNTAELYIQ